jgi:hypothetical protein
VNHVLYQIVARLEGGGQHIVYWLCGTAPFHGYDIERLHFRGYLQDMNAIRYVYWQDGDMWLGYLEEYPDYMTQGMTLEELQENLLDIFSSCPEIHR